MIVRLYNEKRQTSSANAVRFMNATKSSPVSKLIFTLPFSKQYVAWKKYHNDEYKINSSLNRPVYKIPPQSYGIKSHWLVINNTNQWPISQDESLSSTYLMNKFLMPAACLDAFPSWTLDSFNQGQGVSFWKMINLYSATYSLQVSTCPLWLLHCLLVHT